MASCSSIDPLVTPYIDGELAADACPRVEQHLEECPPCRTRVARERAARTLLQAHRADLHDRSAPSTLRARCEALRTTRPTPSVTPVVGSNPRPFVTPATRARLAAFTLAAMLVLAVAGAFVYRLTGTSNRVMAAELAADHVKCFMLNAWLRTAHSPQVVEQEMASRFNWNMHLPAHPEEAGLELVGARPCLYGEGRVAHIMYRHEGRPLSVFMLPNASRPEQLVEVLGYEAAIWSTGDRTIVVIARETKSELQRVAAFVHAALK